VKVLIFERRKNALIGKTQNYRTVKIDEVKNPEKKVGKIIKVKIVDAIPWGLKGKLESQR